jgi:cobalt transporter subunit CbtB
MHEQTARATHLAWYPALAGLIAAVGLFLLGFDQGQALALFQGDAAYHVNLIHELVHDARHASGFPCH